MKYEAVIAYDPGGTTGVAWFAPGHGKAPTTVEVPGFRLGMYSYLDSIELQWAGREVMILGELFTPRKGALTTQLDAIYINGAAEAAAHRQGWGFQLRTPADAKSFSTGEKLRKLGWWVVGGDHARDANKHLLLWLCTTPEGLAHGGNELLRSLVS